MCVLVSSCLLWMHLSMLSSSTFISLSLSLCLCCLHDMATVSQSPPPLSPPSSPLVISASSVLLLLSPPLLPLLLSLPETLSTNKGADLLIWGLCGCCLEGCVFVCVSECNSVHMYVCVFHRFGRGGAWVEVEEERFI